MKMIDKIEINPKICHGKPIIKGTRVIVSNILGALASGDSVEEILNDYPNITQEDIFAALEFASLLSNFETYPYKAKVS